MSMDCPNAAKFTPASRWRKVLEAKNHGPSAMEESKFTAEGAMSGSFAA